LIAGVLPLEFTRFTGNVIDGKAALTWTTANEKNADYFIIERSADGVHYKSIGLVYCSKLPGTHNYSYTDAQYTSPGYYRLKEIDLNGYTGLSPVVILKKATGAFAVNLYPSTASTTITYAATVNQPATAMLEVINVAGKTIINHTIQLYEGVNTQTLDVSQLCRGHYFLKLTTVNGRSVVKQFNKL
jgi:hypothetical protein